MIVVARAAYLALLALIAVALVRAGYRRDRVLGHLTLAAAVLYVTGAFAMGWYLHDVRGRDYLAPDEVAFQIDGQRRLHAWLTGAEYVPILPGGYPIWNALVIAIWGQPSPVPLRVANAVCGVASVFLGYVLGYRLFRDRLVARIAAALLLLSPSLAVWTVNNVKERPLSMFVMLAVLAGIVLLQRWGWKRCAFFAVSVYALAVMRHYYAGIVAWIVLLLLAIDLSVPWRERLVRATAVALMVGTALLLGTGSFMAVALRGETLMRYVELPRDRKQAASTPGPAGGTGRAQPDRQAVAEQIPLPPTGDDLSLIGDTTGAGERAGWRSPSALARSVFFVALGRFDPHGSAGRVMSLILMPEWILGFLLWPLAVAGVAAAVARHETAVALPAAFVLALVGLFAWTHGDDWTTFRFRSVYWPELLVLAAGGVPWALTRVYAMSGRRLSPNQPERS